MKNLLTIFSFITGILVISFGCSNSKSGVAEKVDNCKCGTLKVKKLILAKDYLSIDKYDTNSFAPDSLYSLSAEENRLLWFRDIESADTTKFTPLWNDYRPNNYHADNLDFISYYENQKNIEMAFQFGPGGSMWTYHSFVIKKVECCYVITRSSFTHARFRYKAYAILKISDLAKFREILKPYRNNPIPSEEEYGYHGHFTDNQSDTQFFIDFDNQIDSTNQPTKEIMQLYNFVDDSIKWKVTYGT